LSDALPGRLELTPEGILLRPDGSDLAETIRRIGEMLDALSAPEEPPGRIDSAARARAGR